MKVCVEPGAALLEPVAEKYHPCVDLCCAPAAVENGDDPMLVVTACRPDRGQRYGVQLHARRHTPGGRRRHRDSGCHPRPPQNRLRLHPGRCCADAYLVVGRFVENPVNSPGGIWQGGYYWNAGMFVLQASRLAPRPSKLPARHRGHHPCRLGPATIPRSLLASEQGLGLLPPCRVTPLTTPSWNVALEQFPIRMARWTWLERPRRLGRRGHVLPQRHKDNAHGDVLTTDMAAPLVHATSRLVALVGVQNLVVVETPDAVLVADRSLATRM